MRIILVLFTSMLLLLIAACESSPKQKTSTQGYPYIVHTTDGNPVPKPGEYVYFHAYMRNGDSLLYSSRDQGQPVPFMQIPVTVDTNAPPNPLQDVLKEMGAGDSVSVFINIDTMQRKPPGLEDVKEITYDLKLIEVKSPEAFQEEQMKRQEEARVKMEASKARETEVAEMVQQTIADYAAGNLDSQLQETESGLKYIVHEEGTGPKPEPAQTVNVQYYGVLTDGTMFDNSFSRGQPIPVPVGAGRVIKGWDEGLSLLNIGSKATLIIPPELAYGEAGSPPTIPPNSELIFYVELEPAQ